MVAAQAATVPRITPAQKLIRRKADPNTTSLGARKSDPCVPSKSSTQIGSPCSGWLWGGKQLPRINLPARCGGSSALWPNEPTGSECPALPEGCINNRRAGSLTMGTAGPHPRIGKGMVFMFHERVYNMTAFLKGKDTPGALPRHPVVRGLGTRECWSD